MSDALQVFRKLPAMRQCSYADISIEELSSFVSWSAKTKFDDVQKLHDGWDSLNVDEKCEHIVEKLVDVLAADLLDHSCNAACCFVRCNRTMELKKKRVLRV